MLDKNTIEKILAFQKSEITEYFIYQRLSLTGKDARNREILSKIAAEELGHYHFWKSLSRRDVKPDKFKIWKYALISKVFGLTFGLKLMERGESSAQRSYDAISSAVPNAKDIEREEKEHENQLLNMIDEERLEYIGSAVLGLNDALVELTGALAGFTLALQNTNLVATAGLITGVAASLSMAASVYLSTKAEGQQKNPVTAAAYTGIAYVFTVICLILPFLLFKQLFLCLGLSLLAAVIIIFLFTFYISVAKELPFKKRFGEMCGISLGVSALTFVIALVIRHFLHIDI